MHRRTIPSRTLIGRKVLSIEGQALGRIEELVIDAETGHIMYAGLATGGLLGIGEKLVAIPWRMLRPTTLDDVIYVDVDRQTLQRAPHFEKDAWPEIDPDDLDATYAPQGAEPVEQPHL